MAESISQLQDQIREKEHELKSVDRKISGAVIGSTLTENPVIGATAGAYLDREKEQKAHIQAQIDEFKRKIQQSEREITRLKDEQSRLRNDYDSDKIRREADMRQQWNDLERKKHDADDPTIQQSISQQIADLRRDTDAHEQQLERELESQIDSIQNEINRLAL